ncbi:type I-E CRISPR-associated protein Cse2/CasB [Caenispirillum salinarum]|uniref:type I-E CRISPR-associated protein Cse2/CasB n=1 Tax=Caenispirillum salinarum TaxID=859058 RepID=UPI00384BB38A
MTEASRPYLRFLGTAETATVLHDWHRWLQDNRGARAAMRRARSVDEVWLEEAYSRLRLPLLPLAGFRDEALARAAIAVAEVSEDTEDGLAARAAASTHRGRAAVSADRIRLMLGAEDPDEFLRLLRGVLAMLDREVNLCDVADLVLSSHTPGGRAHNRKRVMLRYYETADPAAL